MTEDSSDKKWIAEGDDEEWGFMVGDAFIPAPKIPLVRAGHETPPFDVTLPGGQVRRIISRVKEPTDVTATTEVNRGPSPQLAVKNKIKVYTATKLKHGPFIRDVIAKWPEVEITSRWPFSHVDGDEPMWPGDCAAHGSIFWTHDEEDVRKADVVLVFGHDSDVLRGGLVEAGIGIGLGKRVVVVGTNPSYGTWQFHPLVYRVKDMDTARSFLTLLAYHLSGK
jgi:hypothetical protein